MDDLDAGRPDADRNFDDLSERFSQTIYDSPRGRLRLAALKRDFEELNVPLRGRHILDAGAGQGQFALWLAQQGALMDLCDVSSEMLGSAKQRFEQAGMPYTARQCAIQDLNRCYSRQFDVVINHAVLEWLAEPLAALPLLHERVAPGGYLSLMFYNLHGHRWRQMMIGRLHAPDSASQRLRKEGNSPGTPLDPKVLEAELDKTDMELLRWRGIRCIYDPMHQKIRERVGYRALEEADLHYGLIEPYRLLGRYVHFLLRRRR